MITITIQIPDNIRVYNKTRRMLTGDYEHKGNGLYSVTTNLTLPEVWIIQFHILELENSTFFMDSTSVQVIN